MGACLVQLIGAANQRDTRRDADDLERWRPVALAGTPRTIRRQQPLFTDELFVDRSSESGYPRETGVAERPAVECRRVHPFGVMFVVPNLGKLFLRYSADEGDVMTARNQSPAVHPVRQGFAIGTTVAAAALLFVAGVVALLQGIAALADNDLLVVGTDYVFKLDVTTWGWIHIILGIIGIVVSLGLFVGQTWARGLAFVIAALSIVANFLWLPYYPLWSIVVIALDVVVIWAVATWRPNAADSI